MGLAPILAPLIGGQILLYASWRIIFLVLAVFGLMCFFMVAWGLPESLPKDNRNTQPLWKISNDYIKLLQDPRFTRYALPNSLMGAGFFTYLAGAAIIFIDVYGISAQNFGWIFALNALGLIASSQLNTVLLNYFPGHNILVTAMSTLTIFSLLLLGIAYSGLGGMVGLWLALFVCVGGMGLVRPNAVAATMAPFGSSAGSASSLMSALGSIAGAISGALLGFFQADTAVPMALIIALNYTLALVLFFSLRHTAPVTATD